MYLCPCHKLKAPLLCICGALFYIKEGVGSPFSLEARILEHLLYFECAMLGFMTALILHMYS
jgi:hypothetical protein